MKAQQLVVGFTLFEIISGMFYTNNQAHLGGHFVSVNQGGSPTVK